MLCRTALLSLVASISSGCTTYITQVQAQESGEDDAASSFPASSYPDADESTTGDAVEGDSSSTGAHASSTGAPDVGTTGDAGSSTSSGSSTGDAPIETTGDASTSDDASSTTGEPLSNLPFGEPCDSGFQCEGGVCFGHPNNGEGSPGRCSLECAVEEGVNNCDPYYPGGTCVFGGVDKFFCADALPEPPLSAHGALCIEDSECKSGLCLNDTIGEDPDLRRCSIACDLDVATSCQSKGSPGICLWTGDAHHCIGSFPDNTDFKTMAAPLPGDNVTHETIVMVAPKDVAFILIPASATDLYIESSAFKGNGNGAPVYDLLSNTGAVLSAHEWTSNNGTFQYAHIPIKAQTSYWLRVRREEMVPQVYSQHWLKHAQP